jgi:hypothetical protein
MIRYRGPSSRRGIGLDAAAKLAELAPLA